MKKPRLGATGTFPQGKLNADDEGALTIAIGTESGKVRINFGKKIAWVAMNPAEAKNFANLIIQKADAL